FAKGRWKGFNFSALGVYCQRSANILNTVWGERREWSIRSGIFRARTSSILESEAPQIAFGAIVLTSNREMKDPKRVRWLTLLDALGLLYVGIDRMFFDRTSGSDPLARIERTLAILAGTLLVTVSTSLFVAAWKGRPLTAMNTNSTKGKLLAHAFCAAPSAL